MKRPQAVRRHRYEGWPGPARQQAVRPSWWRRIPWQVLDIGAKLVVGLAIIYFSLLLFLQ